MTTTIDPKAINDMREAVTKPRETHDEKMWAELQKLVDRASELSYHMKFVDQLVDMLPVDFQPFRISASADYHEVNIFISNPTKDQLTTLARLLTAGGYHIRETYDLTECQTRVYYYGKIKLYVDFTQPGAACGFKQVGTKEVPVMEFRCEEVS